MTRELGDEETVLMYGSKITAFDPTHRRECADQQSCPHQELQDIEWKWLSDSRVLKRIPEMIHQEHLHHYRLKGRPSFVVKVHPQSIGRLCRLLELYGGSHGWKSTQTADGRACLAYPEQNRNGNNSQAGLAPPSITSKKEQRKSRKTKVDRQAL